ncbi:MAG: hypothetical protein ACPGTO_08885 [Polaribacter sp.]
MSTETLKISLAQKILAISDTILLKKVKAFIEKENIVGYDAKDNPIYENDYVEEMDLSIKKIENKTATLYATQDVRKNILNANNLGQ